MTKSEQEFAATVVKWLQKNLGLSTGAASGVVGNMYAESSFKIDCIGDNGTSGGICQWHDNRFSALKSYATSKGKNWVDLGIQLEYLSKELNSSYRGVLSKLKATNDYAEASFIWGNKFEIFQGYQDRNGSEHTKRRKYSGEIYNGVTSGNWVASDVDAVSVSGGDGTTEGGNVGAAGVFVQQTPPNAPRPIMASRGANTVYILASSSQKKKNVLETEVKRRDKFNEMVKGFSDTAPELGRDIIVSSEMFGSEILKNGQDAKTFLKKRKI